MAGFATEFVKLTADGVVGAEDKATYLYSVIIEGTGTVNLHNGDAVGDPIKATLDDNWSCGNGDRGVAFPDGLFADITGLTSVTFEIAQRV